MRNRLKVLRAEHSWTQEECAARLGVSRQTINAIERERFDPTLRLAMRIARLFDLTVEEVFFDQDRSSATTESPAERRAVRS